MNGHLRCTGFPARCLWGAVLYEQLYLKSGQSTTPAPNRVAVHLLTPSFMTSWLKGRGIDGALPTGILWRGLLLNTLFYSALLWLTLHLPLAVRRALRTSHGRCLSCGYDLRATPPTAPCPECGAARLTVSNTQT